jgi:hypothetical protein
VFGTVMGLIGRNVGEIACKTRSTTRNETRRTTAVCCC